MFGQNEIRVCSDCICCWYKCQSGDVDLLTTKYTGLSFIMTSVIVWLATCYESDINARSSALRSHLFTGYTQTSHIYLVMYYFYNHLQHTHAHARTNVSTRLNQQSSKQYFILMRNQWSFILKSFSEILVALLRQILEVMIDFII